MFELNSNNVKKILLIITYTLLLLFALLNIKVVFSVVGYILKLIKPFIYGFCLAFILNIPLSKIENMFKRKSSKSKNKKGTKNSEDKINMKLRVIAIILSLLIFVGIIMITMFLVVPEFVNTISIFKENIPTAFDRCQEWLTQVMSNYPNVMEKITSFKPDWMKLESDWSSFVKNAAKGIIGVSIDFVIGLFSGVLNFFIGLVFAIYMLIQKETLIRQFKKLVKAYVPEGKNTKLLYVGSVTNDVFKKFFGGQFIEAIIIGVLCFIGMTIFGMPYALTISVLIGVTALIPVFGAFFGTVIGAIMILAVNPQQALWFVIYIIVIQQIDGNLIYPRIVGNAVGLPGIWVMLAVIVGGNGLGIVGMLIAVPIASVVYRLVGEHIKTKKIKE